MQSKIPPGERFVQVHVHFQNLAGVAPISISTYIYIRSGTTTRMRTSSPTGTKALPQSSQVEVTFKEYGL